MPTSYKEQQKTVIYNLLAEAVNGKTDTIGRLTDKMGLSSDNFSDPHYRTAFQSYLWPDLCGAQGRIARKRRTHPCA